jgi:hypothetical protein
MVKWERKISISTPLKVPPPVEAALPHLIALAVRDYLGLTGIVPEVQVTEIRTPRVPKPKKAKGPVPPADRKMPDPGPLAK